MKKITFLILLFVGITTQTKATISQVRWGSSGDPLNGLTVTWSSTGLTDSIQWGYTSSFEQGHFKGIKRSGYSSGTSFFKYNLGSVNANSTIYYKFWDSNANSWGTQATFLTAPPLNTDTFAFTALGDCRTSLSVLTTVSNLASAKQPAFSLFNGDLTLSGTLASELNAFFTAASNFLAHNVVYHAEGNHDAASPSTFSNMFDMPLTGSTNLYYAFKYGNAIFITINTCDPTNTTQLTWLQNTLASAAADPNITWKVVSSHHPFFNTGNHTGDMNAYRNTIWKAFDDYGVDLVLNGHDHNYQRSKPINLNVSATTPVTNYGSGPTEGRCEIISGGAGASLYSINTSSADAWAINYYNSNYNYTYCQVQGCKMIITAYGQTGNVMETFTLDKSASAACSTTGITTSPKEKFNPISIFPNPADGVFTLKYTSENTGDAIIKIFDMTGKEVVSEKAKKTSSNFEFKYDMSKYAKGIYTVSVLVGNQKDNAILLLK